MHVPLFSAQALIPMALGAAHSDAAASDFLFLAAAGHQGLLPLLHEPREWPIKVWVQFLPQQTLLLFASVHLRWSRQMHASCHYAEGGISTLWCNSLQ